MDILAEKSYIDSASVTVYNGSMLKNELELTIEQLADRVGVPTRTVRYYIAEGLLPGPTSRGKAATYGEEHLLRLRLIRLLAEQHVPIKEIRERLAGLSAAEIRAVLAEDERRTARLRRAGEKISPREYVSALLSEAREARSGGGLRETAADYSSDARGLSNASPSLAPPCAEEAWCRWELGPGVELHVRADVRERHRKLIDRLLRAAGLPATRDRK